MRPYHSLPPQLVPAHESFEALYEAIEQSRVSRERVADVVKRLLIHRGAERLPSASEVAAGELLKRPKKLSPDVVSRVVRALAEPYGLVAPQLARREGSGRPSIPLLLGGDRWLVIGVKIWRQTEGVSLTFAFTDLRGRHLYLRGPGVIKRHEPIADGVARRIIEAIETTPELDSRVLLGVGLDVSGHVVDNTEVRLSPIPEIRNSALGEDIAEALKPITDRTVARFGRGGSVPVVVDNDASLLAVRETFQPDQASRDTVVVAVFPDGIGSSVVINNRVHRGARGAAGEIGHLFVGADLMARAEATRPGFQRGFAAPCSCTEDDDQKRFGHVDCYATPSRLVAQLGEDGLGHVTERPTDDHRATAILKVAGEALGIALVSLVTAHDPERLVVYLPEDFRRCENDPHKAGYWYWQTALDVLRTWSFPGAAELAVDDPIYLTREQLRARGAECAALRVIDGFIKHGKGRCKCYIQPALDR